ncbi:MAG: type IX secretion system sortase PorU [Fidelibacterota bacterium]
MKAHEISIPIKSYYPVKNTQPKYVALLLSSVAVLYASDWQIIESTTERLIISAEFSPGKTEILPKEISLTVGLPSNKLPQLQINELNSKPVNIQNLKPEVTLPQRVFRWEQAGRFRDLYTAVLVVAPLIKRNNSTHAVHSAQVTISFTERFHKGKRVQGSELQLYRHRIINWNTAKNWVHHSTPTNRSKSVVLPAGDWFRIPITMDGMVKITYDILDDLGIAVNTIDPRYLRLYTNPQGGRPMSTSVNSDIPENLIEVAISITGEDDASFDSNDELLFYARGPRGFDIKGPTSVEYTQNPYTNINYYWLLVPSTYDIPGQRVSTINESPNNPVPLDFGIAFIHQETDSENPYESGIEWFGTIFTKGQTISSSFSINHPKQSVDATLEFALKGAKISESGNLPAHIIKVYQQSKSNGPLGTFSFSGVSVPEYTVELDESLLANGINYFLFENASTNSNSKLYQDWSTLQYGRELIWEGAEFEFWTPVNVTAARFSIDNATDNLEIWDITNFAEIKSMEINTVTGTGSFERVLSEENMMRFIAFSPENVAEVVGINPETEITFTNLRNTTYPVNHIIIVPQEFLGPANDLATYRKNSKVALLETIYNEFSGGVADPLAIRYFLKWAKEYWRDPTYDSFPSYVLLFGDGDYDYRNITGNSNTRIPTFQSLTLNGISSDDRFVYLDGTTPDMAIGRFTASTLTEADIMVAKTIAYESEPEIGLWRRRITLVADDFSAPSTSIITEKTHVENSEDVADLISDGLEIRKIYTEGYPAVSDGSSFGLTRPGATQALFDVLLEGTALINFIGHGNPNQWTHETLLSTSRGDLSSINTGLRLPIWIAGTCSWGKYDNVSGSAMSEELMRMEENGAIAIISTTDPISFGANEQFIKNIFQALFDDESLTGLPLGAVFQTIKTGGYGSELFHLFGDPALRICVPGDTLSSPLLPDTLMALATANYSGTSALTQPDVGDGFAILYDSESEANFNYTLGDVEYAVPYTKSGKTLFRGAISFSNNGYNGGFILPKDVTVDGNRGKFVIYLYGNQDNRLWEGLGVHGNLIFIGGTTNSLDDDGPQITFSSNNRTIGWGDQLSTEAELTIELADPAGINLTGEVGHAIRIWQNEDESTAEEVTDLFLYDTGSYTEGTISYTLPSLNDEIMLTIEAWDNANNVAQDNIKVKLVESSQFTLSNIFNYPNPFSKTTQFAFEVSQPAAVNIKIFTLTGQLVAEVGDQFTSHYGYSHINWDGRDDFGDEIANGAYLYQLTAIPDDGGKKVSVIGKLAKYR